MVDSCTTSFAGVHSEKRLGQTVHQSLLGANTPHPKTALRSRAELKQHFPHQLDLVSEYILNTMYLSLVVSNVRLSFAQGVCWPARIFHLCSCWFLALLLDFKGVCLKLVPVRTMKMLKPTSLIFGLACSPPPKRP